MGIPDDTDCRRWLEQLIAISARGFSIELTLQDDPELPFRFRAWETPERLGGLHGLRVAAALELRDPEVLGDQAQLARLDEREKGL